jgi:N-acetylglucosaminyl-diphospho-decaprenol L-rhamnosyltransferase
MTVDAIVVSFNTRDLLRASVVSLRASAFPVRHVFVVDNASSDGSAQMVATEFPDVTLLEMHENLGFARANNAAFGLCEADAILLLNPDAELSLEALGELVTELEANGRVGAVGPVLVSKDGLVQCEGGRRDPSIMGEFGNISRLNSRLPRSVFGRYLINDWDHRSTRDVEVLSGACMLIRSSALDGRLFCEDFFMYGEDIELCQRLRAAGWTVRYVGTAEVLHRGAVASRKARTRMRIAGVVSMARLLRRTRGPVYAAGYVAIVPVAWLLGSVIRRVWRW